VRRLRASACLAAAAVAAGTATAVAVPAEPHPPHVACSGNPAKPHRLDLSVEGTPTFGYYAVPAGRARGIVVFDHGYSHTAWNWREHLSQVAARDHVITIAMDYRFQHDSAIDPKTGLSSSRGWRVAEGAQDSVAAAQLFDSRCHPGGVNTVYGISMGGNTSGLVVASQPKDAQGRPLFDYWFAVEPAVDVTETWAEASAVAQSGNEFAVSAVADIEEETGGTPADVPDAYRERSVVTRVSDIAGAGLRGVAVVQGVDDGLVPYNQSREIVAELRASGIPVDDVTVGTRGDGEAGTTASGYALGPLGQESPFAGHASEVSNTQLVGSTGFDLLDRLYLHHDAPGCRESFRDGDTGAWEVSPAAC
jgi:hypothetical protein